MDIKIKDHPFLLEFITSDLQIARGELTFIEVCQVITSNFHKIEIKYLPDESKALIQRCLDKR